MRFAGLLVLMLLAGMARADTVVFVPGLGDGAESFAPLARQLPGAEVFNTARPARIDGDADGRRSAPEVARDLRARLAAAGMQPPFVLVGHSIGGPYALAFARIYPNETEGLVLVDPRLPGFESACLKAGLKLCRVPPLMRAVMPAVQKRELDGLAVDAASYADMAGLGPIPVTVLAATQPAPGLSRDWQRLWVAYLTEQTARAPRGRLVTVDSTHYIHKAQPRAVLAAVQAMLSGR